MIEQTPPIFARLAVAVAIVAGVAGCSPYPESPLSPEQRSVIAAGRTAWVSVSQAYRSSHELFWKNSEGKLPFDADVMGVLAEYGIRRVDDPAAADLRIDVAARGETMGAYYSPGGGGSRATAKYLETGGSIYGDLRIEARGMDTVKRHFRSSARPPDKVGSYGDNSGLERAHEVPYLGLIPAFKSLMVEAYGLMKPGGWDREAIARRDRLVAERRAATRPGPPAQR